MPHDFEPFELPANLQEDLGLFEAAARAQPVELSLPSVLSVLVAPDGSNQDDTARAMARSLGRRFSAAVHEEPGLESAQQILDVCRHRSADVIVVPVPFGQDMGELAGASLGSVFDMLLIGSPAPLLCVREPQSEAHVERLLSHTLVPLMMDDPSHQRLVEWGALLAGSGGDLELLELVESEAVAAARIVDRPAEPADVQAAAVGRALSAKFGGLIAATQRLATAEAFGVHAEFSPGRPIATLVDHCAKRGALAIASRSTDHTSTVYHRAADLVLASRLPVLLV